MVSGDNNSEDGKIQNKDVINIRDCFEERKINFQSITKQNAGELEIATLT